MKKQYVSAKRLSLWMRLTKKWKACYASVQTRTDLKKLNKFNSLSLLLGVKRKIALVSMAGFITLGAQAQSFNIYDLGVSSVSLPVFEDIDDDGDLDIVSGEKYGTIRFFENNGSNVFTEQTGSNNLFNGIDLIGYSAPSFVDLDGDADLDLVCGEKYGEIKYFENNGNVFTEQTGTDNPFDGIDVGAFFDRSTPFFVDLNNDGYLDLLSGERLGNINYYKNNGSNVFTEQTGINNPFDGINAGDFANVCVVDVDGDGDLDMISGSSDGTFDYFENNGSNVFTEQTGTNNPFDGLDVGSQSYPSFKDLNNDGHLDLLSGGYNGTFTYFKNDGNNVFTEQTNTTNPFASIDLQYSTLAFVDLDDDHDLDLVCGQYDGTISYFKNDGNNVFTEQIGVNNLFDGINLGYFSSPTFADLDNDGDLDLICGEGYGTMKYFKNDGNNVFIEQTGANNPFSNINQDYYTPTIADIDGDGDLDLICGESYGTIHYFENDGSNIFTEQTGTDNPFDAINVGYNSNPTFKDMNGDGDLDLICGESYGTIHYYENDGNNSFIEQTGTDNPFLGVDVNNNSTPVVVDLDNNGYVELYTGNIDGAVKQINLGVPNYITSIFSSNETVQLAIYPNPASSIINTEEGQLEILDALGNLVLSIESNGKVDISGLESGIYFVTQNGKRTKLFIE